MMTRDARKAVIGALAENVHGLVFVVGAIWLYVGLHGVSPAAANIVAGLVLLAIGAWPYLRRTYLARPRTR
jgi:hypothetical protein